MLFRVVPVFTSPLWYLKLPQSSQTKVPILLGCSGSFSSMHGFAFNWVATCVAFLKKLLKKKSQFTSTVCSSVVLIIIYWFSSLAATHKFSKNDLYLCFNSRVKMLNNRVKHWSLRSFQGSLPFDDDLPLSNFFEFINLTSSAFIYIVLWQICIVLSVIWDQTLKVC